MIGADNGNRSQAQGEVREGSAERSAQENKFSSPAPLQTTLL
jgi:hypothetical protein